MSAEPPLPAPLPLRPEGGPCGCGCLVAFLTLPSVCAVSNLVHPPTEWGFAVCGGCASVAWLALVAFVLVLTVCQVGLGGVAVALLGMLSRRHFADARPTDDGPVIGFGFQLFGRRFYYLRVTPDQITSLDMSSGQATAHAGHDMNDWSVALWYLPEGGPTHGPWPGGRTDEVYMVGPARARAEAAVWLAEVVAFLRAAGVNLEPGEEDTEFRHRRE